MKLLADENFDNMVVHELLRQRPKLDLLCIQDMGFLGADDPAILEWAAQAGRILLTHDVRAMTQHVHERLQAQLPLPGIIEIKVGLPLAQVVEDLILLIEASEQSEWEGQIQYLPLK